MKNRDLAPLKAAQTRANKSGDREKILAAACATIAKFASLEFGWPDNWPSFRNQATEALEWNDPIRHQIEDMYR